MFEEYYKTKLAEILDFPLEEEDGLSNDEIQSKLIEAELITIPQALFEYYLLVGNLNSTYNDIVLPIDCLGWDEQVQDMLVFMFESQNVARWGILKSDLDDPDPDIWMIVQGDVEWFQIKQKLSKFLMRQWRWEVLGEEE